MRQHQNSGMRRFVLPVASVGLVLGSQSACTAEGVTCQTAHGDFAVQLTLTTGAGECAEQIGGWYGVQTYSRPRADGRPDFSNSFMAIKSEDLGILVDDYEAELGEALDPTNQPYSVGDFKETRPSQDLCEVPALTGAKKVFPPLPAIPATLDDAGTEEDEADPGRPDVPSFTVEYGWSNMKFIVSPAVLGTVFTADFTYKRDACTATYQAVGLYPAVFCGDDDGNPDDNLCAPEANAALGIPLGSGINPDFKSLIKCHPDLLLCMFEDGKLPNALK